MEQHDDQLQDRFFKNTIGVLKINKYNNDKRDGHLDETVLHLLSNLDVDIVFLVETNINWNNLYMRNKWA